MSNWLEWFRIPKLHRGLRVAIAKTWIMNGLQPIHCVACEKEMGFVAADPDAAPVAYCSTECVREQAQRHADA